MTLRGGIRLKVKEVSSKNSLAQVTGEIVRKCLICDFLQQWLYNRQQCISEVREATDTRTQLPLSLSSKQQSLYIKLYVLSVAVVVASFEFTLHFSLNKVSVYRNPKACG